ncbi:MAG: 5'-3' exonuclease H3TH domain-containing protein, partial [Candidatus Paceibacterales bacterium]
YEADDLLGTLAMQNLDKVDEVVILSGDRDVLQLVDGKIKVQMPGWNLATTSLFGSLEVKEKYGITPLQMVDYKAMTGDASDNIPGVGGIGPKTAAALLQKYKTLEGIYGHIDEISGTTKDKLEKDKEIALAAKKLVKLDCDVDLEFTLGGLEFKPNWDRVIVELEGLGFKSIVVKLQGKVSNKVNKPNVADESTDQLELI